ncbi:hypothetical protein EGS38_07555 [Neisseria chenwenguii]|nr:hypothetical protein EGS38_07555 [Neisseria chenwenguii]
MAATGLSRANMPALVKGSENSGTLPLWGVRFSCRHFRLDFGRSRRNHYHAQSHDYRLFDMVYVSCCF